MYTLHSLYAHMTHVHMSYFMSSTQCIEREREREREREGERERGREGERERGREGERERGRETSTDQYRATEILPKQQELRTGLSKASHLQSTAPCFIVGWN